MKLLFSTLSLWFIVHMFLYAQDIDQVKTSDKYIWGQGSSRNMNEADRLAIHDLMSQISTTIDISTNTSIYDGKTDFKAVMNTYSNATLTNAKRIVQEKDGNYVIIRYIEKDNIDRIFETRRLKIMDYLISAETAEEDLRIGDALKYYYWSLVLLQSHPYSDTISADFDGRKRLLITSLPAEINRILALIQINPVKIQRDEKELIVNINLLYKKKPIVNLDYNFWIGNDLSSIYTGKDGRGIIEILGLYAKHVEEIKLNIEYVYENQARIDKELASVIEVVDLPNYPEAQRMIPVQQITAKNEAETKVNKEETAQPAQTEPKRSIKVDRVTVSDSISQYTDIVQEVCKAIDQKKYEDVRPLFTENGWDVYSALISYGEAKIIDPDKLELSFLKTHNGVLVRSIPMLFTFQTNNRKFIENVTFRFDSLDKIDNIAFGLSDISTENILKKSKNFASDEDKALILSFMEDYKTAYCLERIDFIDQIFAEEALIIVGRVLKTAEKIDGMYSDLSNDQVEFVRLSKQEYVDRLRRVFSSNEFVNIEFEENQVRKLKGNLDVYGIQIKQYYHSTNYGDVGYLFLMFDLRNPDLPKILVRSWQPQQNVDGSIIGVEDRITGDDFKLDVY